MASVPILVFSLLSLFVFAQCNEEKKGHPACPPFRCGGLGQMHFPFSNKTHRECGVIVVDGCDQRVQKIQLQRGSGKWYEVADISQDNVILVWDRELEQRLKSNSCLTFNNLSLPNTSLFDLKIDPNITLFKCYRTLNSSTTPRTDFNYKSCHDYDIYFNRPNKSLPALPPHCSIIQLPAAPPEPVNLMNNPFKVVVPKFNLRPHILPECYKCFYGGGYCQDDSKGNFACSGARAKGNGSRHWKLWTAIGGTTIGVLMICSVLYLLWSRYRRKYASSNFFSVESSSDPSAYFGIPVFAYSELEKATNFFDSSKELGDGGFGTVYHGRLRDGREVAVKRLYKNNYKRVEQFMNEIKILTGLRHPNLVTLYGCTSRHSRELLLAYEYIPNGTVSDHLHGDDRTPNSLTWPVRLRIAVETASALAYLHASGIIHRDVKTNNILLDNNFSVKVADFGLSRLFPTDVTHISTAPQGTPGYVDPEYHQCYQLTEKSDVFSFGVVLIELISSMPAVDIFRDRDEINLSNFAVNRIRDQAFHHLVDPCLGFESDFEVRRMTILVAELAFWCLQLDRDKRPSMDEASKFLNSIQGGDETSITGVGGDKIGALRASPASEDNALLKRMHVLTSPTSVADKWVRRFTTPNVSA